MDVNKDYLTTREAAQFCGVSYHHFVRNRSLHGIAAVNFMGKLLYRKRDLIKSIEKYAPN
jgi:hypothetical protein